MPEKNDRLTPNQVRARTIEIRVTGRGDAPQIFTEKLVNAVESIGREVIAWKGPYPAKSDPELTNVFLTVAPGGNYGNDNQG